jgi:hypothetical protein
VPENMPVIVLGMPIFCSMLRMALEAWLSATPGARLKEIVTEGYWPW